MKSIVSFTQRTKWVVLFPLLFCLFFVPNYNFLSSSIAMDDKSYVSHAFTIGLDFDMDYSNEIVERLNKDKTIASHPIGAGILATPFVALFGIVDKITSHPVILDRFQYVGSWSYFGFLFSANLYYLLGVFLFYKALNRIFDKYGFALNFLITLSTGVIYYVLVRFTMSHGFEFFMLAFTLWSSVNLYFSIRDEKKVLLWLNVAGFASVANLWVRPANYNTLLIPYMVLLLLASFYRQKIGINKYLLLTVFITVYFLPYFVFNQYYFHSIFPTVEEVTGREFRRWESMPPGLFGKMLYVLRLSPNILLLFFSSEFGLLYTNPVLLLGMAGLMWFIYSSLRPGGWLQVLIGILLFALYFGLSIAVVLVWRSHASDYGYRYLFGLIPMSMLGFAYLYQNLQNKILKGIFVGLFVVGVLSVFFYIKTPLLKQSPQVNVYGVEKALSAKGYTINLIKELAKPETYVRTVARSYMGFLIGSSPDVRAVIAKNSITQYLFKTYFQPYKRIPQAIYVQTYLLLFLWVAFGFVADRKVARKNIHD